MWSADSIFGTQFRIWVGEGLSYSAETWRFKDRDRWSGWSEEARRTNLQPVVCDSRFLIVPTVRVPNLASQVLSRYVPFGSELGIPGGYYRRIHYLQVRTRGDSRSLGHGLMRE